MNKSVPRFNEYYFRTVLIFERPLLRNHLEKKKAAER